MSDSQNEKMVRLKDGTIVSQDIYAKTEAGVKELSGIELLNFINAAKGLWDPKPWRPGDEGYMKLGIVDENGHIPEIVKTIALQSITETRLCLCWVPPEIL